MDCCRTPGTRGRLSGLKSTRAVQRGATPSRSGRPGPGVSRAPRRGGGHRRDRARRPARSPVARERPRGRLRPACGSAVPPPGAAPPAPPGLRWRPASSRAGRRRPGWRGRRAAPPGSRCGRLCFPAGRRPILLGPQGPPPAPEDPVLRLPQTSTLPGALPGRALEGHCITQLPQTRVPRR